MTHEMDPQSIIDFGRDIAVNVAAGRTVVTRFSPGNGTSYELTFVPMTPAVVGMRSPGEFDPIQSVTSRISGTPILVTKTEGSNPWAWWISVDMGYLSPDYVKKNTALGWGDVAVVGLLLNALRGVQRAELDASPYIAEDGSLDTSLGGMAFS